MKSKLYRPPGYRILGNLVGRTEKAMQFEYYGWIIWLPASAVVQFSRDSNFYSAPAWAIDSAKEHESAMRGTEAEEFLFQRELQQANAN